MLAAYLISMNKYYLDGVLVVEGKDDVSYLSSFIDTLYFTTNGYDISEEKLNFLSRVASVNKVYLLTDNDEAGIQIADKIKSKINGVFEIKTPKIFKKSTNKYGVAETTQTEIIRAFKDLLKPCVKCSNNGQYNLASLISLSSSPSESKYNLISKYRLIGGNIKSLEKQLKMLRISKEEINQFLCK